MHLQAFRFVACVVHQYGAQGPVYEIGSRNINGSVRGLFEDVEGYHGIDLVAGPEVDAVADAATYTPPITPATVVCCEVLEHARAAAQIVAQAAAVLAPGGLLILTMAGPGREPHSAVDGGPLHDHEFYQNVAIADLLAMVEAAALDTLWLMATPGGGDLYYAGRKRTR